MLTIHRIYIILILSLKVYMCTEGTPGFREYHQRLQVDTISLISRKGSQLNRVLARDFHL